MKFRLCSTPFSGAVLGAAFGLVFIVSYMVRESRRNPEGMGIAPLAVVPVVSFFTFIGWRMGVENAKQRGREDELPPDSK